jgi:hypothetical protein
VPLNYCNALRRLTSRCLYVGFFNTIRYIIQPDWGDVFFARFTTPDDDTLFAYRDRLRKYHARMERSSRREHLRFSKEAFLAKLTDLRLRNEGISLVVLRVANDPFHILLLLLTWQVGILSAYNADGLFLIAITLLTSLNSLMKAINGSLDVCRARRHIYDADGWWNEVRTVATYFNIPLQGPISVEKAV